MKMHTSTVEFNSKLRFNQNYSSESSLVQCGGVPVYEKLSVLLNYFTTYLCDIKCNLHN